MTPTERLLAALQERGCNPRRTAKGYSAKCPAHEDRRASLSINEGDNGGAVLHCFAGCEPAAVVAVVGLTLADLMPTADKLPVNDVNVNGNRRKPKKSALPLTPERKPRGKAFVTARDAVAELERRHGPRSAGWTYHNAQGQPVGVVVRWNLADGKKDIRPASRYGDGWRIEGMSEPRPLYALPDLAGASRVYVCEGEKAADAVRDLGLVATTSAHGCGSANKTDWSPLAGKEVIILPDNDSSGLKYAETVVELLRNLWPSVVVKIVDLPELPEHGDAVDFIAAIKEGHHG